MNGLFDAFLDEHRRIEAWLKDCTGVGRYQGFMVMAEDVARVNPLLKRHLGRLRDFNELRNLLTHKKGARGEPIAMPSAAVVEELRGLADRLTAPPSLPKSVFHPVTSFGEERAIGDALKAMREGNFSQVPVTRQGDVFQLLTANTIARWLAACVDDGLADLIDTPISMVLKARETNERWDFYPSKADSAEVLGKFIKAQEAGKPLAALLLTDSGARRGPLRGIVTASDLGKLARSLVAERG